MNDVCPWCESGRHDLCRPDVFWCSCSHPVCLPEEDR